MRDWLFRMSSGRGWLEVNKCSCARYGPPARACAGGEAHGRVARRPDRWILSGEGNLMTTTPSGESPADAPCPCGHTADEHDPLASRYCRATAEGALDRACMCVSVPVRFSYDGVAR